MKSNKILAGRLGYLKLKYYSRNKDSKQLLDMLVKLVVFIVRGDVTWREIIAEFVKQKNFL